MRELKFRAWDKESCKWCSRVDYDYERGWLGITPVVVDGKYIGEYDTTRGTVVEQYTGLKDRTGEEICEGDIVLDYYEGDDAFIVEWDKDTASFRLTGTDNIASVSFDNFYSDEDLEVIGNIHENPELLKG